jgi:hypothetical protein
VGYVIIAPLDARDRIDARLWRAHREAYGIARLRPNEDDALGHLVHRKDGGWAFHYDGVDAVEDVQSLRAAIRPVRSSAMVAAIGTGDAFAKGRDFAAWLGLIPKQISTGDRTIRGKTSKRGNRYLRVLFVQAAWVVLVKVKPARWESHGLKRWTEAAKKRLHRNVLAIAVRQ